MRERIERNSGSTRRVALLAFAALLTALALVTSQAGATKVVKTTFGGAGAQGGQFAGAGAIAVNVTGAGGAGAGDLYVAEDSNDRIQRLDGDGSFIEAWGRDVDLAGGGGDAEICSVAGDCKVGEVGTGEGEFNNPLGVAVDQSSGDVYVLDRGNFRIQQFTATGTFVRAWGWGVDDGSEEFQICGSSCQAGLPGANGGQLNGGNAASISLDGSGGVYVSDSGNGRVQKFTAIGEFVRTWGWDVIAPGKPGDTGAEFEICTSTAPGDCQAAPALSQSDPIGDGQFAGSNTNLLVAADSAGNAYVSDQQANHRRVQKFAPSGAFDSVLAIPNAGTGPFYGIATTHSDDHVFVSVLGNSSAERRIEEFDSAGNHVDTHAPGGQIATPWGIAVNTSTEGSFAGRMYAVNGGSTGYLLEDVPPPIVSIDPVDTHTATTADLSGTVEPDGFSSGYRFEYSSDAGATWQRTFYPDVELGDGSGAGEPDACPEGNPPLCLVAYQLTDLEPNTEYLVRLRAANSFGVFATAGPAPFITDPAPPLIGIASSTASSSAITLRATVNPQSSEIEECRFEWGATAAYGNSTPCASLPPTASSPQTVVASIGGLAQASTHHYRLIARNGAGTTIGPDRTIQTGPGLPDDRAWEMVSPVDKNGGDVIAVGSGTRVARELSPGQAPAFAFKSLVAFGELEGTGVAADYMAIRTPEGWRAHGISPLQDSQSMLDTGPARDSFYQGEFSPDLSRGLIRTNATTTLAGSPVSPTVSSVRNLFLRTDLREAGTGSYDLVTACPLCEETEAPLGTGDVEYKPKFYGASDDFEHILFSSKQNLVEGASGSAEKAYGWADGAVRLAGRIPASGDFCDDEEGPACVAAGESLPGAGTSFSSYAISDDGSRILFTAGDDAYLRTDGARTEKLNASERTVPATPEDARLWTASADGSRIFFTTDEPLIDADEDSCSDLYMYDADLPSPDPHNLTRISTDKEPADEICAGAIGPLGEYPEDGSETVYFLASKQLVTGQDALLSGHSGIYRWHDGEMRFVAQTLDGSLNAGLQENLSSGGAFNARTTPDGSHLLFSSHSGDGLGGHDHGSKCEGSQHPCVEFYLYDAEANGERGEVTCASCKADGGVSTSSASVNASKGKGGSSSTDAINAPLSADGRFAFFDTSSTLVPEDTNGQRDVYRYDADNGNLKLISSGEHGRPTYFLNASEDGDDVFFATRDPLSGWDVDEATDVYDARVGGGLPEPPPPVPGCAGDACQPPPVALNDPTPASSAFAGAGNASPRKAKAGKRRCPKAKRRVKRRGKVRCVAKKRGKKGKRGAKGKMKHKRYAKHGRRAGR